MSEKLTEVSSDGETETETATELYDVPVVAR